MMFGSLPSARWQCRQVRCAAASFISLGSYLLRTQSRRAAASRKVWKVVVSDDRQKWIGYGETRRRVAAPYDSASSGAAQHLAAASLDNYAEEIAALYTDWQIRALQPRRHPRVSCQQRPTGRSVTWQVCAVTRTVRVESASLTAIKSTAA